MALQDPGLSKDENEQMKDSGQAEHEGMSENDIRVGSSREKKPGHRVAFTGKYKRGNSNGLVGTPRVGYRFSRPKDCPGTVLRCLSMQVYRDTREGMEAALCAKARVRGDWLELLGVSSCL